MSTTALLVFTVWALGLVLAFAYRPIFALFSYLWIFYNDPQTSWWGANLPQLRYSLIAATIALIATLRLTKTPTHSWWRHGVSKLLVAYAVWVSIQTPWAVSTSIHIEGVILAWKYVVLSYVIFRLTASERDMEWFTWAHVGGCFLLGWRAHMLHVSGRLESIGAPGVDDSNILAAHLATGLAFAGFLFLGLKGYRRWAAFLVLPFIVNAIILTESRGGFLTLLVAALAALYFAPKGYRRLVSAAVALGAVLVLILGNQAFWSRIDTILVPTKDEGNTRVQIIGPELNMVKDHPFGAGYRGAALLSPKYMATDLLSEGKIRSAHNTFMAALVDQGIPGAILLLGIYGWTILSLVRLKRLDAGGCLPVRLAIYRAAIGTALVGCFVSGMFLDMLTTEVQIWLLAILCSLIDMCNVATAEAIQSPAAAETGCLSVP